jgi:hypothetical protein
MEKREVPSRSESASWPSYLRGTDASEVHARLGNGDPLGLRERTARRLRETWFLLDPDRVYLRALSVCAIAATEDDPPAELATWTTTNIDRAIEQLVLADRDAERTSPGVLSGEEKNFPLLTTSLMLDPELVRTASVAFNALDPLPRRAFFELLIEGMEVGECIEKGPWDADGLYAAVHAALATVGLGLESEGEESPRGRRRK